TLFYKDIDARNYYFTLNGNTVNNLTAVLKINKAILTIEDVPECSVTGGAYNHTKTLADYPIIGIESSKIRWVNPQTIPTVNVTNYRVIYNPDANNYFDFQFGLPLAITKAEIDGATMVIESQFLPYTGVLAKPNFTVNGNKDALMLEFDCETDMTSIGKHNVTSINVSLIDTDNYTIINTPTIGARYFCIYSSSIYDYQGLQLAKYKGSAATVSLMDGTKSIRSDAFKDNAYVRAITVPDSVTSISLNAFSSIPNLYEITLPFIGRTQNAGEELGKVFGGTNQSNLPQTLEKVTVSLDGEISVSAFANASYIKEVNYLTEVTSIGSAAFQNCAALENVALGDSVISIGEGIFRYCFNLKEIKLPFIGSNISDIKTISYLMGSNAGENVYTKYTCTKLELVSESLTTLPSEFLKDFVSLNIIILPVSVTSYGSEWVSNVSAPIMLNSNMTILTYGILKGYKGNSITIPSNVTQIANAAFYNASNLQQIIIPNKVTSIGEEAFYNVTAQVIFAEETTISTLGNKAFYNYGGTSLIIPNSVTTLNNSVFENSKIMSARVPANVINMGNNIYKGSSLETVTYEAAYVASGMFANCVKIYRIDFSSNLEEIKASAFEGCNRLGVINIGANVQEIGEKAFYNCNNLGMINMLSAVPPVLGANAFLKTMPIRVYITSEAYRAIYQNTFVTQYGYTNMEFSIIQ
ncbi:MAG: leucine-rich repeat domain-containing protein, partial [Clostridia bacterium]|nr:leucine-rich repeat domain-containing protein [Clostridia bacterium]